MADLIEQLKKTFHDWDQKQSGIIPVETLQEVLKKLNPSFSDRDIERLVNAADAEGTGLIKYSEFVDFLASDTLASAAGPELPSGTDSDAKVSRLNDCIAKIRDPRPGLKTWMQDMRELLDPHQHPQGYKLCQSTAIAAGAAGALLRLTQKLDGAAPLMEKDSDAIRSLAWELLARLSFGNDEGAEAVASEGDLVGFMQATLRTSIAPEKLSALQLVQALAAAPGQACSDVVPTLLEEVAPLLSHADFRPLQEGAFDVLVSSSRGHAPEVVAIVGWPQLAAMTVEGDSRPEWLPAAPLQVFLSGRMAVDLLTNAPEPEEAEAKEAREKLQGQIGAGRFLGLFAECLEAAVARREWPLGTEAYHAVGRLAEVTSRLSDLGHARQLLPTVAPLAKAVEVCIDDQSSKACLRALRALSADVACLETMLAMEAFRSETLEMLHKSGDEPEATDLLAFLEMAELAFADAQAVLDATKAFMKHAPSVRQLAEIFVRFAPLDSDMTAAQVLDAALEIPLLPSGVKAAMGGSKFGFKSFAQRVYGTPTILGWWPSLMEDTAEYLRELGEMPRMPSLGQCVKIYEECSGGKSTVDGETIMEKVLPAASLPSEGFVVEAELSALGAKKLDFKALVKWLGELCRLLEERRKEEQAEAAEAAEAEAVIAAAAAKAAEVAAKMQ